MAGADPQQNFVQEVTWVPPSPVWATHPIKTRRCAFADSLEEIPVLRSTFTNVREALIIPAAATARPRWGFGPHRLISVSLGVSHSVLQFHLRLSR